MSHLRQLIPTLLDPVELVVKKISGNVITGKKLMHYVEVSSNLILFDLFSIHTNMLVNRTLAIMGIELIIMTFLHSEYIFGSRGCSYREVKSPFNRNYLMIIY